VLNKSYGFVPLRGGSKSIKLKNIKPLNGKPLCYYVLNALQNSALKNIFVATDSYEIVNCVKSFNFSKVVIYNRNPENATDTASSESVLLEFLNSSVAMQYNLQNVDNIVFAQATSPFTTTMDINNAIDQLGHSKKDSLLTAVLTKRFFWNKEGVPINYNYKMRPRRQDFEGFYMENGAFYINRVANILQHKNRLSGAIEIFEMPEITALEIDEPLDWFLAEEILKNRGIV
jgi:CMP-N-acetylneuraminic acid synthetase